jgi:hypothetical protein
MPVIIEYKRRGSYKEQLFDNEQDAGIFIDGLRLRTQCKFEAIRYEGTEVVEDPYNLKERYGEITTLPRQDDRHE